MQAMIIQQNIYLTILIDLIITIIGRLYFGQIVVVTSFYEQTKDQIVNVFFV